MGTAIIGGLVIGFGCNDWLGRCVLVAAVGLYACVELFFTMRKRNLNSRQRRAMGTAGMSKEEIDDVEATFTQMSRMSRRALHMTGWRLYAWQFIWTSVTALPFSLLAGMIRVFVIDK